MGSHPAPIADLIVAGWFDDDLISVSNNVSVALSGISSTGQIGSFSSVTSASISGNQASGAAGTLTSAKTAALSGNAATGSVGTVTPASSYALTGIFGTGAVGTVTFGGAPVTVNISGNQASALGGILAPSTSTAIAGIFGTGAVGTVTFGGAPITVNISGNQASALGGTFAPSTSTAIAGSAGTGAVGTIVASAYIGLTGNQATGRPGTLTETHGSNPSLQGVGAFGQTGLLTVTATGTPGIVPYVVGVPEGTARFLIIYAAMNVGTVSYTTSDTFSAGLVISQSIAGGTTEPLYTPVSFVVSSGPTVPILTTTVPNVVGLPSYQAGSTVSNDGLIINTFYYSTSDTIPAGVVISQSLVAGTVVPTGTLILLIVSLGAAPVTPTTVVPNVVGLYLWDAVRILTQDQLIVEPWVYAESASVAQEYVISQSVNAGTTVNAWAPVSLIVSDGA
jgi:beta-lactam-binding protein with PASTA domain